MIRRIDAAVLQPLNKPSGGESGVSVKDVKGVSALFAGLRTRANEVYK